MVPHKKGDIVKVGYRKSNDIMSEPVVADDGRVFRFGEWQSEYYNPKTRKFYVIKHPNAKLNSNNNAIKMNDGRILLLAVANTHAGRPNKIIFNPKTNSFEDAANLALGRAYYNAIPTKDGKVFIAGGTNCDYTRLVNGEVICRYFKTTKIYNPKTNQISNGPNLPEFLTNLVTVTDNNDIYLIGGEKYKETDSTVSSVKYDDNTRTKILKVDFEKNSIQTIADFKPKHRYSKPMYAFNVETGKILILGNDDNDIKLFNSKTGEITILEENLPLKNNPILLPDKRILFPPSRIASLQNKQDIKKTGIYDYKNNKFQFLDIKILSEARDFGYSGILLKDGNILLLSGSPLAQVYMLNNKIE